jgi:beta-propeller repeat-containing protein
MEWDPSRPRPWWLTAAPAVALAVIFVVSVSILRGILPGPASRAGTPLQVLGVEHLGFEPNQGQTDPDIRFLSWAPGFLAELRSTSAVVFWGPGRNAVPAKLEIRFVGGRPPRSVAGHDPLAARSHYVVGNDPECWRTDIPQYASVEYAGVYPGVDVVFQGRPGEIRYDFVVAPGADPGAIALEFEGARDLRLEPAGDLVLATSAGEVRHRRPLIYQEGRGLRRLVEGRYVLRAPKRVGVEIAAYDPSEPLVIDPTLVYSTYLGGVRRDYGDAVVVDAEGAAYIAGGFNWGDNTDTDVFVAKFDPTGRNLLWRARIGGQFSEGATGLVLDPGGRIYLTGWTGSYPSDPPGRPEYPRTPDAFQPDYGGGISDAFVSVLAPTGTLEYSTFLGGGGDDRGQDIALDAAGDSYLAGVTNSADFPLAGAFQSVPGGDYDAFTARMNPDKSALVYSSYLGGAADDRGLRLAVDDLGNAYVAGTTGSLDFPTAGALQASFGGGASDAFLSKVSTDGSRLVYSTYLGGIGADEGRDVALDAAGQAYVTGMTDSPDFPTANPLEGGLGAPPNADAFLSKLAPSGDSLVYSTYLGAKGGNGVVVDAGENAFVTGGGVLAAKLDSSGSALLYAFWALGGNAIAVDGSGAAYVTGGTYSNLLPTVNAFQARNGGMFSSRGRDDAFLVKISDTPAPPPDFNEDDGRVSYTGTWTVDEGPEHSGGRVVFSDEAGASATITFTGTGLQLIGRREESSGYANVTVGFMQWGSVDTYASPAQDQSLILSITGLTSETHTLTVTVSGGHNVRSLGNRVWIDGFNVIGAPEPEPTPSPTPEPTPTPSPTPAPTMRIEDSNLVFVGYTGPWSLNVQTGHSAGTAMLSMEAGARATVSFSGTGVRWIGLRDESSGVAAVHVDGVLVGNVDTYASPSQHQAMLFSIDGLSPGAHTLAIEATGTRNEASGGAWVWVDAFDVVNGVGTPTIPAPPLPFSAPSLQPRVASCGIPARRSE